MKPKRLALRISGTIFGIVAVIHLIRILTGITVLIGGFSLPIWINWMGLAGATILCAWLWGLSSSD